MILINKDVFLHSYEDYHNNLTYWNRLARANHVDPDQMPRNVASDLGLQCLPLIQQFLDTSTGSQMDLIQI